jgi:hypothetical protein
LRKREPKFPKTVDVEEEEEEEEEEDPVFDVSCDRGRNLAPRTIMSTGMFSGS